MNNHTSSSALLPERENDSFLDEPSRLVKLSSSGHIGTDTLVPYSNHSDDDDSDMEMDDEDRSFKRQTSRFQPDAGYKQLPQSDDDEEEEKDRTSEMDPLNVSMNERHSNTDSLCIRPRGVNHRSRWWIEPYTIARRKFRSSARTSAQTSLDVNEGSRDDGLTGLRAEAAAAVMVGKEPSPPTRLPSVRILPRPPSAAASPQPPRTSVMEPSPESEAVPAEGEEPPMETCVHGPKVGALCIDRDGYTVSDGNVSISRDFGFNDDCRWKSALVRDLERLELQKVFLVDAHTERSYRTLESLLPGHLRASSKTSSFGFVDLAGSESYRKACDSCKKMRCHRWRAIRYGIRVLVRYDVPYIPH